MSGLLSLYQDDKYITTERASIKKIEKKEIATTKTGCVYSHRYIIAFEGIPDEVLNSIDNQYIKFTFCNNLKTIQLQEFGIIEGNTLIYKD